MTGGVTPVGAVVTGDCSVGSSVSRGGVPVPLQVGKSERANKEIANTRVVSQSFQAFIAVPYDPCGSHLPDERGVSDQAHCLALVDLAQSQTSTERGLTLAQAIA